ncbi:MAG: hypothetical protein QXL98_01160 [Thermofilaceae archaeon]
MAQSTGVKMKRVGWWHFELMVPTEWDIAAQGGSRSVQVFRLADSAYSVRLEVSLEKVPFEKAKSAEELLDAYRKSWEKKIEELRKKEGIEAELKHVSKDEVSVKGHRILLWAFRIGGAPMMAAVWYCEKSERAVSLTFTPRSGGDEGLFRSILDTVRCHYDSPSERALWSTLLFDLYLPQAFGLVSAKFASTATYCLFTDSEQEKYLLAGYSGLASFTLGRYKKGLKEWFEKEIMKDAIKNFRQQPPKVKFTEESESVITFSGVSFALTRKGRRVFLGRVWHDRKIDRILAAAVLYPALSTEEAKNALNDLVAQLGGREI